MSICHSQVGGVTNIAGMFGFRNLSRFRVEVDPITHSIEHIIKHSERPMPCSPDLACLGTHYRLSDRLSAHHLDRPVLLSTPFSRTGWGQRKLLATELGHAYDLPSFVQWNDRFRSTLVPIQLLRVALDHALLSGTQPTARPNVKARVSPPRKTEARGADILDAVFLPDLQKWLAG